MEDGKKSATITVTPQPIITSVTIPASEQAPTSDEPGVTYVQLRPGYFTTLGGILKLVEILIGVICMACASPAYRPGSSWFLFVVVICFIISLTWIFVYLLGLIQNLKIGISWLSLEFAYNVVATVLYFTAFIVQLSVWSGSDKTFKITFEYFKSSNLAAGCFGLFNTVAYGVATFLLYKEKQAQPK